MDFKGQKRTNKTHASTTDPHAKLMRKGPGKESKLSWLGNVLMENRSGLVVASLVKEAELLGLVERMLEQARNAFSHHQEQASRDALLSRLTTREAQVLERIVAGRLNKQIADDLGISIKTVEAHRANIMEKLNANTVADLLKIALGATAKS